VSRDSVDFKIEANEIPPESLLIRAAAESYDTPQRTVERGKPNAPPKDAPALDHRSHLNQIEAALNSILAAARSSVGGKGSITEAAHRQKAPEGYERARSHPEPRVQPQRPDAFGDATSRLGRGGLSFMHPDDEVGAGVVARLDERRPREAGRPPRSQPPSTSDELQTEISKVSETLRDLDSHGSIGALGQAICSLTQEIEASRSEGIGEPVFQTLERLVGELKHSIALIDPRERIGAVKRQVKGLSANSPGIPAEQELPTEGNEPQLPRFVEDVSRQRPGGRKNLGEIRAFRDGTGEAVSEIEQRLDAIAAKVEEAIAEARDKGHYEALSQRIESVRQELTVRIAEAWLAPDTKPLEELLLNLSEKLDKLQKPQGEKQAIEALEQQVSELGEQFDRSNASLSSVANIEGTIGELLVEMERIPNVAFEAAENAARSVLKERGYNSEISQELERLRSFHDEADQRTLSTLTTVHDVLKKLVDRLGIVEEALSNRPKPSEPFASRAAPGFTFQQHDLERSAQPETEGVKNHRTDPQGVATGRADPDETPHEPGDRFIGLRGSLPGLKERPPRKEQGSRQTTSQSPEPEIAPLRSDLAVAARHADPPRQKLNFVTEHKGLLLFSLVAIFASLGTYLIIGTMSKGQPANVSQNAGDVIATNTTPQEASAPPSSLLAPASSSAPLTSSPMPQASEPPPEASASTPSAPQASAPVQPASAPVHITSVAATPSPAEWSAEPTTELAPNAVSLAEKPKNTALTIARADLQVEAESGNPKAQFALAMDYAEGRQMPRDLTAAAQWFRKAAAQGLAPAQLRLAFLYQKGWGVQRDLDKARVWYLKAAEQGNVTAMHDLAVLAADSKPDYTIAAQWFKKAADYGLLNSQFDLALLLSRGLGVQQNLVSAYAWFAIAAAQGDNDAAKWRDALGAKLDPDQLATARAMASSFRAKAPDTAANDDHPLATAWQDPTRTPASGDNKAPEPEASDFDP
jgi:localization factor PodJL